MTKARPGSPGRAFVFRACVSLRIGARRGATARHSFAGDTDGEERTANLRVLPVKAGYVGQWRGILLLPVATKGMDSRLRGNDIKAGSEALASPGRQPE